jgi:hypothetical protein
MDAVDGWPMAKLIESYSGVSPSRYPLRRDLWTVSSSCGVHVALSDGAWRLTSCVAANPVGNLVGAIGWW